MTLRNTFPGFIDRETLRLTAIISGVHTIIAVLHLPNGTIVLLALHYPIRAAICQANGQFPGFCLKQMLHKTKGEESRHDTAGFTDCHVVP